MALGSAEASSPAEDAASKEAQSAPLPESQVAGIRSRIEALHARQADFHKNTAAGEFTSSQDLQARWPQISEEASALRRLIVSLNDLGADSPERPGLQDNLLSSLQQVGIHLESASHPDFDARILDAADIAEMKRI